MKNLNSFKAIGRAIEGEAGTPDRAFGRQAKQLIQETRRWDDNKRILLSRCVPRRMRMITGISRIRILYRLSFSDEWTAGSACTVSRSCARRSWSATKKNLISRQYDADILTGSKRLADLFEETTALCGKPKKVSNWLMVRDAPPFERRGNIEPEDLSFYTTAPGIPDSSLLDAGTINQTVAKEVFEKIYYGRCGSAGICRGTWTENGKRRQELLTERW